MKINLPKDVKFILDTLILKGYDSYIVGGCVRDTLLWVDPKDWDICTSATPEEVLDIFSDHRIIETGLKHGTVTIVLNDVGYEITTFRVDGEYKDNRRPEEVTYTSDIIADLSRRDLTINSMAYNDIKGLIDPFEGRKDLENKMIRCVGDANERFNEDALRILRAIRFASRLRFDIAFPTAWAIYRHKALLKNISVERIMSEFDKILMFECATNHANQLFKMHSAGVLRYVIPELYDDLNYDIERHIDILSKVKKQDMKMAILLSEMSLEQAEKVLSRLRYPNKFKDAVLCLLKNKDINISMEHLAVKCWLRRLGVDMFKKILLFKNAMGIIPQYHLEGISMQLNDILENKEIYLMKDLAINGDDLISLGFRDGKMIGHLLEELLRYAMNSTNMKINTKPKLIECLTRWLYLIPCEDLLWRDKSGFHHKISEMDIKHIKNIQKAFKRDKKIIASKKNKETLFSDEFYEENRDRYWEEVFRCELLRRSWIFD